MCTISMLCHDVVQIGCALQKALVLQSFTKCVGTKLKKASTLKCCHFANFEEMKLSFFGVQD